MTIANVAAAFRVTGVYPLNRNALLPSSEEPEHLSGETGIPFLPMCSPFTKRTSKTVALNFTEEEVDLFETRFENGYDIRDDTWYNKWLEEFHPEAECHHEAEFHPEAECHHEVEFHPEADSMQLLQWKSTSMSSFLSSSSPPNRTETFRPKSCGRVLTSAENTLQLEEKERKKEEKKRTKREREERRKAKAVSGLC